ncbi:FeoA domain-containing protein [Psychrobacter sp.]|uniref:FeoA family protein n=1 Tax=Psychrobacter sp. TaxID=56811 RepID=UPI0025D1EB63|nr:FeoA domain-containing protein [Psychrobacter sp.]
MKQAILDSAARSLEVPIMKAKSQILSLFEFDKNQTVIIKEIVENPRFGELDAVITHRLKDLGFLPNTMVRVVAKGLFGKPPYAVQLSSGVQFSLRMDELKKIRCQAL